MKTCANSWDFYNSVNIILKFEGGYSNDLNDPGGETNWGISKRRFPHLDIKNLTREDAEQIYKKHYWEIVKCAEFPVPLRLAIFDSAVNHGVLYTTTSIQKLLSVTVDGMIGPITLQKAREVSPNGLLLSFLKIRTEKYLKNSNFHIYGKGWMNRLLEILYYSRGFNGNN